MAGEWVHGKKMFHIILNFVFLMFLLNPQLLVGLKVPFFQVSSCLMTLGPQLSSGIQFVDYLYFSYYKSASHTLSNLFISAQPPCAFLLSAFFPPNLCLIHVSLPPLPSCVCVRSQSCLTLCNPMDCSHQLLCPWDSPGKNTGVGCHFLLQGIFPTQGSNPILLDCRQMFYQSELLR